MPISDKGHAVTAMGVGGLIAAVVAFAIVIGACGSSSGGNTFNGQNSKDGGGTNPTDASIFNNGDGTFGNSTDSSGFYGADAFFAMDPPLMYCPADAGPANGGTPGGTPMCPDDKNREGCPCDPVGMTAACWPGLRAQRGVGQCKDGVTTCIMSGEQTKAWGPCVGDVLPTPGATTGAAACKCFSNGEWAISNLSPCFETDGTGATYALSSTLNGSMIVCVMETTNGPYPAPSADWATDTLKVDCAGTFNLCYTIKAGNAMMKTASDCTVGQVCTKGLYSVKNVVQNFPSLPGWAGMDATCAAKFVASGGYGEMSVQGESITCDVIDNGAGQPLVFQTVSYCPLTNPPPNCQSGGSGMF
jgi:hypothetical protein